jgi:hypothetical protein
MGCVAVGHGASESDAVAAVDAARQRIDACYALAADAAKAGANVSGLLLRLDDAGALLSRAELALGQGDFNSSSSLANESEAGLVGFESDASALKNAAVVAGYVNFWVDVVGSLVGAVCVVVCGFFGWRLLRKRYPRVF